MQNTTKKTLVDAMVSRFLCWKLPKEFAPDAGIHFAPGPIQQHEGPHWPTGTNLLHAGQAQEMIEHMLGDVMNPAALDVLAERRRQIESEGWTARFDDERNGGELACAAACYAFNAAYPGSRLLHSFWPWSDSWWKPKDARRDLVKAGALILAELERLDRFQSPKNGD